jgi:Flp pilus assembly protein TadD
MKCRFVTVLACGAVLLAQEPLERAWQLAANGQRQEAVRVLRELIETNPQNADARLLLGSLLMEEGQGEESISQLTAAVRLRPRSVEAENRWAKRITNSVTPPPPGPRSQRPLR